MTTVAAAPRQQDPLLTIPAAAARLQISRDGIYRRIHAGEIPTVQIGFGSRSRWRIQQRDLEAYIDDRTTGARRAS